MPQDGHIALREQVRKLHVNARPARRIVFVVPQSELSELASCRAAEEDKVPTLHWGCVKEGELVHQAHAMEHAKRACKGKVDVQWDGAAGSVDKGFGDEEHVWVDGERLAARAIGRENVPQCKAGQNVGRRPKWIWSLNAGLFTVRLERQIPPGAIAGRVIGKTDAAKMLVLQPPGSG